MLQGPFWLLTNVCSWSPKIQQQKLKGCTPFTSGKHEVAQRAKTSHNLIWSPHLLLSKKSTPYSSFISALNIWTWVKVHEGGWGKNKGIKRKKIPGNQSSSLDLILCFQFKIIIYKSWLTGCLCCFYATYKQSCSHIYFSGLTDTFVVCSLATETGKICPLRPNLQSVIPSRNSHKSEGPGCCIPSSPGNNRAEWSHLFYSSSSSSPQGVQVGVEICSFRIARDHRLLLPVPFPSLFPRSNFVAPAFLQAVGLTGRSYYPIWWITGQGLS